MFLPGVSPTSCRVQSRCTCPPLPPRAVPSPAPGPLTGASFRQVPCPDVAVDEICLAPFEGVYYRGLISAISGQTATVYFVDYGNTEKIDASEVGRLFLVLDSLREIYVVMGGVLMWGCLLSS